jgi:gamma-glutamyl hydrolase
MKSSLFLLFLCIYLVLGQINNRPIIGVLNQPADADLLKYGQTYIPASYVKWLESSGARVVPVPYNAAADVLDNLFSSLNGILFTGGGLNLAPNITYFQTSLYLWNLAKAANDNGDYFPRKYLNHA